jgi:hypothetical protein
MTFADFLEMHWGEIAGWGGAFLGILFIWVCVKVFD